MPSIDVRAWIVAPVALIASAPPSVKDFLLETAAVTTASTVIISFLGYLFLPRVQKFIWKTIENDPAKYDELRIKSFTRQTAAGKEVVRLMLVEELKELEALAVTVDEHHDRLKFLDTAVIEHGRAIQQLPLIASAMESSAASVKEIARTMRQIHEEVTDHGKRLERWDGYFEGQRDGEREGERRHRARRSTDIPPDYDDS